MKTKTAVPVKKTTPCARCGFVQRGEVQWNICRNVEACKRRAARKAARRVIGWTVGDGSGHEGYNVADYFDATGAYLGPDAHGIEPIFDEEK